MGYFDGLTDAVFKKDAQGRALFFPFGVLAKGRVVPDEATKQRLRNLLKRYYQVSFTALLLVGILVGWIWATAVVLISLIPFYAILLKKLSGFQIADSSLSISEAYQNSARSHNKFTLWVLFTSSVVFVLLGLAMTIFASGWDRLIGCLCTFFFGLCSWALGYMIRVRGR